ncbi:MAG TPA: hypothetical protein VFB38_16330 [Chthonomonadaceae bacterium]|nr:hypothetical protein [Chthonomonadaceae bacterium]
MSRRKTVWLVSLLLLVMTVAASAQIGKILKGGGIAYAISQFGPEINRFINGLTKTSNASPTYETKVVPVLSAGTGAYVGGVQVMGPRSAVDKVQAVVQLEGKFNPLGMRVRALVPVATKSVTNIRRIPGVGISGLLDFKL